MKRVLCTCLAAMLLILAVGAPALAVDFSGLTLEELYDARALLEARIAELEGAADERCYEAGVYRVGEDLPEGDYALIEREDAMFASVVVRDGEAVSSALILHKLISGQADIRLEKDTWVTLSEVDAWPLGTEPSMLGEDGLAGEGAYLVGEQLPAGAYLATPQEWAPLSSYSVYSGILGTDARLTRFEILHKAAELSLSEGEYIELSGCELVPAASAGIQNDQEE